MKVTDVFVRALENEGVQYVFGVPGEENEDLLFSLDKSEQIEFVPTRHEQGAAFMADVWGRLTGEAGVCLSTLGPGATNLMTGVADANLDKSPLVALTGQGDLERLHHASHQMIDVVSMLKPITKWNTAVSSANIIPEVVRKAFKISELEKPGATHLELSEDVARMETEVTDPLQDRRVRRPSPDSTAIDQALLLLEQADKPLIIAGNGAIRNRASRHLTKLVDKYQLPVAHTFMGKGALSDNHPCSLLTIGLGFKDYVMEAVEQADLVMTVGYDIAEYPPDNWNPQVDKKIIHIDFEEAEVYDHYQPEVEIVADISASLRQMADRIEKSSCSFDTEWFAGTRQRIVEDIHDYTLQEEDNFHTPGTLNIIRDALPEEGLLISDVGSHKMWIARNFPTYTPNGCIISNGMASMGIALPGGIAASLLDPDRPVVTAMGDGGFLMNAQELETATRLGVGFTVIVFNDNDYGLISWKQRMEHDRSTGTRIDNPDFVKFAESFGIKAYRPTTVAGLEKKIKEAVSSNEMRFIEVPVDPSVNTELTDRLSKYWR